MQEQERWRHKSIHQKLDEIFEVLENIQRKESSFQSTLEQQSEAITGLTDGLAEVNKKLDSILEAIVEPAEIIETIGFTYGKAEPQI